MSSPHLPSSPHSRLSSSGPLDPHDFTHLHVASGYSMRYGASTPAALVARAADLGMSSLALTDRDGLYGAVKFVRACQETGLAPVLGVDLATAATGLVAGLPAWADPSVAAHRRTPVRGGATVDPRLPRATVLALGDAGAGQGWGALCELVSATHLAGERGSPVSSLELVAAHAAAPDGAPALAVLLGPASEVGRAVLARRDDLAATVLRRWQQALPAGSLHVEVVCHHGPQDTPASAEHAGRMLALARAAGVPAVLTGAVRYADPDGAPTADLLDAVRRLVPLDTRHLDRTTGQGHLLPAADMVRTAVDVARAAGGQDALAAARDLLAATAELAARARLDPRADLGMGLHHLPDHAALGLADGDDPDAVLRARSEAGLHRCYPGADVKREAAVRRRLDDELAIIRSVGFATYFLTVADVCDLTRELGVRVAARGSGAGSVVNHLLGISGVEPLEHGLLMERFLNPRRGQLPDIDLDVEAARREEVYEAVLDRFGGGRVTCVSMMDTYRVRHAVRDVGAALGLPPVEVDAIATAFPHLRARDARSAIAELPELRRSGLGEQRLDVLFDLVERLDGLPRHIALHPCGVVLSNPGLLRRTPVEASWRGFPMSHFDKDDVEDMGLLKLDVLGIRMQSAMAYAVQEVARVDGEQVDLDDRSQVPLDDPATYRLVQSARTLGCFQIESPGQRELVGKFAPSTFADIVIDISLFRPGPVKSDMVNPFLRARQGWSAPQYLDDRLRHVLEQTYGVVVFHEQVIELIQATTGHDLALADEYRRHLGTRAGQDEMEPQFKQRALEHGYPAETVERIWEVLKAFASFGFCKAHAAAFALPTYQSAWLKTHHPAAFLAGVLTHDPGMYPKRLILDDARNLGIAVLGLDVNASGDTYRVERLDADGPADGDDDGGDDGGADDGDRETGDREDGYRDGAHRGRGPTQGLLNPWEVGEAVRNPDGLGEGIADGTGYGIRLSLAEVKGISEAEVARIVAGQPYRSLADLWHRARPSRPIAERLVLAGAVDSLHGLRPVGRAGTPPARRGRTTRRDLLLQVAELDRWTRSGAGAPAPRRSRAAVDRGAGAATDVREAASRQSRAPRGADHHDTTVQLALDLGDAPEEVVPSGLPEMTGAERVRAEIDVLGLDASAHVVDFYAPLLRALGTTSARDLLRQRSSSELLVAGVKVATQTPPVRSGRRVVFLTLDDTTGPLDATFFEDAQGPYAATVFHSWLLVVRGVLRRTGPRGVSMRATGAWELPALWDAWSSGGIDAVRAIIDAAPVPGYDSAAAVAGAAASRSSRPVVSRPPVGGGPMGDRAHPAAHAEEHGRAGGMGSRRVLVHASGFRQSPYADVRPPGEDTRNSRSMARRSTPEPVEAAAGEATAPADPSTEAAGTPAGTPAGTGHRHGTPRKLWHSSQGSSGW
ncbi:DNA polymerase III subunit alpha [Kineococcus rubinsiae]|uniref:DNA polymerase III subunit alpha n=1 Tax=Kineococcus rubinsiae TaxID=2609562 RepID=UPI001431103E|nr:DNA polymerase III subunit alpha [Kineococcus rubinsiae]NIZ92926.1 DNA polymerase III subunit alpha [Kineococcus rubinsiae]